MPGLGLGTKWWWCLNDRRDASPDCITATHSIALGGCERIRRMSENRDVVRSAYDAFAKGDIGAVLGVLSDGVEWDVTTVVPQGGSFRGRDSVGEFFRSLGEHWSELDV